METAQTTYAWHDDITVNGQPYPTRHPIPYDVNTTEDCLGDLDDTDRQHLIAIHEAAHAVAVLASRAHIHHAKIRPLPQLKAGLEATSTGTSSGHVFGCNFSDGQGFAVYLGAGERAEDRWLTEQQLWTPRRAAGIELGACGDRQQLIAANPHVGFGADHNDYRVVHDLADQFIHRYWQAITDVADALTAHLHLTGDQIADLAQLPNGTHSTTCTLATA